MQNEAEILLLVLGVVGLPLAIWLGIANGKDKPTGSGKQDISGSLDRIGQSIIEGQRSIDRAENLVRESDERAKNAQATLSDLDGRIDDGQAEIARTRQRTADALAIAKKIAERK